MYKRQTYFSLYNENDTPYEWSDDTLVASSGTLFENEKGTDQSKSGGSYIYGTPQAVAPSSPDCSGSPYHNQWWQMATGLLPGTYRLRPSLTRRVPHPCAFFALGFLALKGCTSV